MVYNLGGGRAVDGTTDVSRTVVVARVDPCCRLFSLILGEQEEVSTLGTEPSMTVEAGRTVAGTADGAYLLPAVHRWEP